MNESFAQAHKELEQTIALQDLKSSLRKLREQATYTSMEEIADQIMFGLGSPDAVNELIEQLQYSLQEFHENK